MEYLPDLDSVRSLTSIEIIPFKDDRPRQGVEHTIYPPAVIVRHPDGVGFYRETKL